MEVFRGAMAQLSHCPCMCLHRAEVFDGGLSRGNGTIVPFAPFTDRSPQKIRSPSASLAQSESLSLSLCIIMPLPVVRFFGMRIERRRATAGSWPCSA
jgi:hypothetical protein